jgi:hypothetical protein
MSIFAFLSIFIYSNLAFGVIFSVSGDYNEYTSAFDYFWKMPFDLSMGDFDSSTDKELQYTCFMIASIVNVVILLNLLISILGDSFDKFQVTEAETDRRQMLESILEVELMASWVGKTDEERYIHICKDISGDQDEEKREGKILALEKKMDKIEDLLEVIHREFMQAKEISNMTMSTISQLISNFASNSSKNPPNNPS